jgi:hypothetical protein
LLPPIRKQEGAVQESVRAVSKASAGRKTMRPFKKTLRGKKGRRGR